MSEKNTPTLVVDHTPVRPRGRPRKEPSRHFWIHARVTAEERAALEAAAERLELPLGPYVISAALNAPQRRATRKPAVERAQLAQTLGLLGRVSGNLNQLTKLANQTRQAPDFEQFEAEFREQFRQLAGGIMAALRGRRIEDDVVADQSQPPPSGKEANG